MTGTTDCGVGGSWVCWGCGGIDVDDGEVAVSDDDDEDDGGSADEDGNVGIVGIGSKPSGAAVDDAMGEVGGPERLVVVTAPPGTKAGRRFAISRRGCMTGGKRYNLHQLILPDASILPASKVGV
jgi:hypothetical protein